MRSRTGRVLILDDDSSIGQTIALMANCFDMDSKHVSRADEFFYAIDDWHPTHIVLDLVMPEMDGVQVLQQLALQSCLTPIAISSGVGARVLQAAQRSGAEHGLNIVATLAKPFNLAAFEAFLNNSQATPATPN